MRGRSAQRMNTVAKRGRLVLVSLCRQPLGSQAWNLAASTATGKLTILIVEEHRIVREGVGSIFQPPSEPT